MFDNRRPASWPWISLFLFLLLASCADSRATLGEKCSAAGIDECLWRSSSRLRSAFGDKGKNDQKLVCELPAPQDARLVQETKVGAHGQCREGGKPVTATASIAWYAGAGVSVAEAASVGTEGTYPGGQQKRTESEQDLHDIQERLQALKKQYQEMFAATFMDASFWKRQVQGFADVGFSYATFMENVREKLPSAFLANSKQLSEWMRSFSWKNAINLAKDRVGPNVMYVLEDVRKRVDEVDWRGAAKELKDYGGEQLNRFSEEIWSKVRNVDWRTAIAAVNDLKTRGLMHNVNSLRTKLLKTDWRGHADKLLNTEIGKAIGAKEIVRTLHALYSDSTRREQLLNTMKTVLGENLNLTRSLWESLSSVFRRKMRTLSSKWVKKLFSYNAIQSFRKDVETRMSGFLKVSVIRWYDFVDVTKDVSRDASTQARDFVGVVYRASLRKWRAASVTMDEVRQNIENTICFPRLWLELQMGFFRVVEAALEAAEFIGVFRSLDVLLPILKSFISAGSWMKGLYLSFGSYLTNLDITELKSFAAVQQLVFYAATAVSSLGSMGGWLFNSLTAAWETIELILQTLSFSMRFIIVFLLWYVGRTLGLNKWIVYFSMKLLELGLSVCKSALQSDTHPRGNDSSGGDVIEPVYNVVQTGSPETQSETSISRVRKEKKVPLVQHLEFVKKGTKKGTGRKFPVRVNLEYEDSSVTTAVDLERSQQVLAKTKRAGSKERLGVMGEATQVGRKPLKINLVYEGQECEVVKVKKHTGKVLNRRRSDGVKRVRKTPEIIHLDD